MIFVFTIGSLHWSSQPPANRETGYSNVLISHYLAHCLSYKGAATPWRENLDKIAFAEFVLHRCFLLSTLLWMFGYFSDHQLCHLLISYLILSYHLLISYLILSYHLLLSYLITCSPSFAGRKLGRAGLCGLLYIVQCTLQWWTSFSDISEVNRQAIYRTCSAGQNISQYIGALGRLRSDMNI